MSATPTSPVVVGRYAIFDRIASGGMAAVHVARLVGEGGFTRTVAIKRLHPQFALDPEFVAMFLDEARLAARIRHPNVVATLDIVTADGELFLVMDYVDGESLSASLRTSRERGVRVPVEVAAGILVQALHGLHAAHEAKNDLGEALDLVHRDVSPHNLLVGTDGVVRVLDFGIAKALGKLHTTRDGQLKGKLGYLAPEQVFGHPVTRRTDVFAAGVVLWEALAGQRLFAAESEGNVLRLIMDGQIEPPSKHAPEVPPALDAVVMRALAKEPADRFDTALVMAEAIEDATLMATARGIAAWLRDLAGDRLEERAQLVAYVESSTPAVASPPAAVVAPAQAPLPDVHETEVMSVSPPTDGPVLRPRSQPRSRPIGRRIVVGGIVLGGIVAGVFALARRDRSPGLGATAAQAMTSATAAPTAGGAPLTASTWPTSATAAPSASAPASPPASPMPARPTHAPQPLRPATVHSAGWPSRARPAAAAAPAASGLYTRE